MVKLKRQLAVATYLMDKLGLRAGTENKVDEDDDEADIVSCRRLKVENVKAISPNLLEVSVSVTNCLTSWTSDELFDKLDTCKLKAHLKALMPGLTAEVLRAAVHTMCLSHWIKN